MERNNGEQEHTILKVFNTDDDDGDEIRQPDLYQKRYRNSLSGREMESLTAICDTFLPSINVDSAKTDESLDRFFRCSASMNGTPQHVGGVICERLRHPKKWLLRATLWMLATRIGCVILCGSACVSTKFPYFHVFSELTQKKREEILHCWSLSYIPLLGMFFRAIKFISFLIFFTQVDEKNLNISWKAIDYCGPDPDLINSHEKEQDKPNVNEKDKLYGPLYKCLINLKLPISTVAYNLRQLGFPTNSSLTIKCDAVVVGSGSGGGVIAGVLANAGYKVVVLEKGNYFARNNLSLLEGPTMDEMYLSGGLLVTDDIGTVILAGSTVGGGSTINWSASIKTPQHVINEWSNQLHLEMFDSELYQEALGVVCEKMGVQSEIKEEGLNNSVLRRGCEELRFPVENIPRNSSSDHYCGWCSLGCKNGEKKSTAETWLVDLANSGNGVILPGCAAIKILHKKQNRSRKVATGVVFEFEHGGIRNQCIVESKVTIVACGALRTPILLQNSGFKNSNIGKNLHLHPVTMAWGYFPDNTLISDEVWPVQEKKSHKGGIMTAMSTIVSNVDKSGYGAIIQTPSLHPGMFSSLMPWVSGLDFKIQMTKFSRIAHIFALARDTGSGTVNAPHSISYRMSSTDEMNLQKGIEKVLRILAAAGAEEIGTHHCKGRSLNVKRASSEELERFVKEESGRLLRDLSTPICSAHQMGSCRMGTNPKNSVVNEMGETWEVEGVYVADTSVFPTALGVNPMVTVQAIAYCTAQSVLAALKRKKCT
ncbi:hypothetical protein ACFE04_016332 [Oxalis oulophora]